MSRYIIEVEHNEIKKCNIYEPIKFEETQIYNIALEDFVKALKNNKAYTESEIRDIERIKTSLMKDEISKEKEAYATNDGYSVEEPDYSNVGRRQRVR